MYYKLPVKERIGLLKSYRKVYPNMSYHDMVKDYNDTYEKFVEGGKKEEPFFKKESDKIVTREKMLTTLKPRDYIAQKANYEEQTRGANQMDGSGISSAELAYKYSKLISPPGLSSFGISAIEIGKNAYNGDKQDLFDYLGLLRLPYIKEGMKELPKLTKQLNKLYLMNNVAGKTNDIIESYE